MKKKEIVVYSSLNEIETGIWTRDSLNIFLPIKLLQNIDSRFYEKIVATYEESGKEVLGKIKRPPIQFEKIEGADIKAWLVKRPIPQSPGESNIGIEIGISSKLATSEYFKGITKDTIKKIYKNIIQENKFNIDYEVLLDQKVNDLDLCINFYKKEDEFITQLKKLQKLTKEEQTPTPWGFGKNEKTREQYNIGLQWQGRKDNSEKKPFSKFYSKLSELMKDEKNHTFYKKHIEPYYDIQKIEDLRRFEINIRNYAQKARIVKGSKAKGYKTLRDVLELTQKDMQKMANYRLNEHVNLEKMEETDKEEKDKFVMADQYIHIIIDLVMNELKCSPVRTPQKVIDIVHKRLERLLIDDKLKSYKARAKSKIFEIWNNNYGILNENLLAEESEDLIEFLTEIKVLND